MRAPGACHHARWMAKLIYVLKLALLRNQLLQLSATHSSEEFSRNKLSDITDLATFLCLFYVKPWFTAPNTFAAAGNDLALFKQLTENIQHCESRRSPYPSSVGDWFQIFCSKFDSHLWYLSERLVTLCLFSGSTREADKKDVATALLKCSTKCHISPPCDLLKPIVRKSTKLRHLVSPDSWTIFQLLKSEATFLRLPSRQWSQQESYKSLRHLLSNMKVTNDASEHVLGLISEYHSNTVTKSTSQKQSLYRVVQHFRNQRKKISPSATSEQCSKKVLSQIQWK